MLRTLEIRDMLIIDRLDLEFQPGLNVLTGETGAGKSILLDSLGFVLGFGSACVGVVPFGARAQVARFGGQDFSNRQEYLRDDHVVTTGKRFVTSFEREYVRDPETGEWIRQAMSLDRFVVAMQDFVFGTSYMLGTLLGLFATAPLTAGLLGDAVDQKVRRGSDQGRRRNRRAENSQCWASHQGPAS